MSLKIIHYLIRHIERLSKQESLDMLAELQLNSREFAVFNVDDEMLVFVISTEHAMVRIVEHFSVEVEQCLKKRRRS